MPSLAGGPLSRITLASLLLVASAVPQSKAQAVARATSADSGPQPGPTDTIIFSDGFESGNLNLWLQDPANNGRYSVTTDPARVHSGTRALEALYTPTNTYGMIFRRFMPGYDEIYIKFDVMFEEGFQHGPHFLTVCGNRIDDGGSCFGRAGTVPNGTDFFYAGMDPDYVGDELLRPLSFYTYWPDMSCCYGNRFVQPAPQISLIGGQWQEVVFHIKLNTPGQSNGSQTLWVNGVKKIDMQNMRWRTTTDLRLNMIRFDNWTQAAPKIEHVWVDDVTIWRP